MTIAVIGKAASSEGLLTLPPMVCGGTPPQKPNEQRRQQDRENEDCRLAKLAGHVIESKTA